MYRSPRGARSLDRVVHEPPSGRVLDQRMSTDGRGDQDAGLQ